MLPSSVDVDSTLMEKSVRNMTLQSAKKFTCDSQEEHVHAR